MSVPGRKLPAQGVKIDFHQPTVLFVTVCSKDRVPWMASTEVQQSLEKSWRAEKQAWMVGDYLLMPDHIHLFCAPRDLQFTLEKWVSFWKRDFSRANLRNPGEFQRGCFHHRLRSREECTKKWIYVRENPIRKGLAKNLDDWPFQGRIHPLAW